MRTARGPIASLLLALATCVTASCGPSGLGVEMDPLADQTAYVASAFELQLRASGDSKDLRFSYRSNAPSMGASAEIRPYGPGAAVFRWTPSASHVGSWTIDFSVTDGSSTATESVRIEVKTSVGANGAPKFRKPLGSGTTLDLKVNTCLDLDVVVEDNDTAEVTIAEGAPRIEGAELDVRSGFTAKWHWCPTAQQIAAQERYALVLTADDRDNPKTTLDYMVVLQKPARPDCPGAAPTLTHSARNATTVQPLEIDATIADAEGIKGTPRLYYTDGTPADPPVLADMTQVSMRLTAGDARSGTWRATIPNPVASMPTGARATLRYLITASDDDDTTGDCDHKAQAPERGTYEMTVTRSSDPGGGGGGGLSLCAECTADSQCGGAADNCLRMGGAGRNYCGRACTGAAGECPTGYTCSTSAVASVGGVTARQCVPTSMTCSATPPPPASCTDTYEPNDSKSVAMGRPVLPVGTYPNLRSCPLAAGGAYDDDWYRIEVGGSSELHISISGGTASDIDLALTDNGGDVVQRSTSVSSNESITACVPTGTYFIRVYGFVGTDGALAANTYSLTWAKTSSTCGGGGGGGGGTGGGTPVCGGSCGGIDYAGRCDGGTVKWCVSGVLQCATCGTGTSCGWDDDDDYYACLSSGGGGGTTTPVCGGACGGIGYTGECSGSQVRWCENGTLSCSTCSSAAGESCGWNAAESYYDCVTSGGGGGGGSPVCGGSCGSIGYEGECNGTGEVRWCEGGVLRCQSCTGSESCGYDYGNSYYGCIDGGYSI